ncbi:MAG: phosphotransferase, partial [Actinomycetota bacterium]
DEVAIDLGVVRSLLATAADHLPDLDPADPRLDLVPLPGSGTDNVLWRVRSPGGADVVLRLPRTPSAGRSLRSEVDVLAALVDRRLPVSVPQLRHVGQPTERFPHPWAVLDWVDGVDAWSGRAQVAAADEAMAEILAETVTAITDLDGLPVPVRESGRRGGPLGPLLDGLDRWLDDPVWAADDHLDTGAIRRLAAQARELVDDVVEPVVVHGDLLPGNLILGDGGLRAVIDWGSAALADPAQDLTPAWAVLGPKGRAVFRAALGVDDAAWLRGRAFELEHAVGAVLYYRTLGHPLAEIMARTLEQVLVDDPGS